MKKQLVICGVLIIIVGFYKSTFSNTDENGSTVKTAVNELAVDKPIADEPANGQLAGEYLEVRRAAASAHPDAGMAGHQVTLAWRVREGSHIGVPLDGLAVVAVVFGNRTFGTAEKTDTRTTFLVDARADKLQQAALVAMAKALAPDTIRDVAAVKPVKIDMNVCRGCAIGYASLEADTITVRTRRILDSDKTDGSPETARPMLANVYFGRPAFTLEHSCSGYDFAGKPVAFVDRDVCSAVVGGF